MFFNLDKFIAEAEQDYLDEEVGKLSQQSLCKLHTAVESAFTPDYCFKFSNKKYLQEFKPDFDTTYDYTMSGLVCERIAELNKSNDPSDIEEARYLDYWFRKESEIGGLFNFF